MAVSRRAFIGGLAAVLLAGPSAARGQEAPRLRGWRWQGGVGRSAAGSETVQTIRAPYEVNAVGLSLARPTAGVRVRASVDGAAWSNWTPVTWHEAHGRPARDGRTYADLAIVPAGTRLIQVAADDSLPDLQADLIDAAAGPTALASAPRAALGTSVPVLLRGQWGCDERLRFDARGDEIWPAERYVPEKVVVHHTATQSYEVDSAAAVRSIYYYHAVSQGWGDIGYNYLVDWRGNVYEGRFGGRGVEAGHAYGHNPGSIGIACIGSFETSPITTAARQSLARLIAQTASYVDPHDSSWFKDGEMPNLMGHRDAMQYRPADATTCPGDSLYDLLPGLRGDVLYNLGAAPSAAASIVDLHWTPEAPTPGSTLVVTLTIKNTGTATLSTQDPAPGLLYQESDTIASRGLPGKAGCWRVGLELGGGDYPFRWGLPQPLEPGQTATVVGQVKLGAAGPRLLQAGLVREQRYWAVRAASATALAVRDPIALPNRVVLPLSVRSARP